MSGFVYVIRAEETSMHKVGYTASDPASRMASLQTGCPHELSLVTHYPGTPTDEVWAHEALAGLRVRGEWFRGCTDEITFLLNCGLLRPDWRYLGEKESGYYLPDGTWVLVEYRGVPVVAVYDAASICFWSPHVQEVMEATEIEHMALTCFPRVRTWPNEGRGDCAPDWWCLWPESVTDVFPYANDDHLASGLIWAPLIAQRTAELRAARAPQTA